MLRIERAGSTRPFLTLPDEYDIDRHGRFNLRFYLKRWEGAELVLRLADKADMLSEGFRPDVMERLWSWAGRGTGTQLGADLRPHDGIRP
ncbi:hypothetical protein [Mesorhizobium wenxiniae]|uniref:hypothetical protein n=1 Tax=Mesorhizobium wenxiniae TaxID=2014805 RepID=UPI002477D6CD|nr:hypothetical protein [Mesorhizobium wenxiniae]